jgi:hypothetical protein
MKLIDKEAVIDILEFDLHKYYPSRRPAPYDKEECLRQIKELPDFEFDIKANEAGIVEVGLKEELYPCIKCGKLRTKEEGGTTFTYCEKCWDNEYKEEK